MPVGGPGDALRPHQRDAAFEDLCPSAYGMRRGSRAWRMHTAHSNSEMPTSRGTDDPQQYRHAPTATRGWTVRAARPSNTRASRATERMRPNEVSECGQPCVRRTVRRADAECRRLRSVTLVCFSVLSRGCLGGNGLDTNIFKASAVGTASKASLKHFSPCGCLGSPLAMAAGARARGLHSFNHSDPIGECGASSSKSVVL